MQFHVFEFLYAIGIHLVYSLNALLSLSISKSIRIAVATTVIPVECKYM